MTAVLKEDPDDLANLVSTADVGCNMTDANMPTLDDSVPIFSEMFDELMLPDGYGALLPDDINSLDSQSHKIDPFMSYRDESSETMGTPHNLSPCLSSKVNCRVRFGQLKQANQQQQKSEEKPRTWRMRNIFCFVVRHFLTISYHHHPRCRFYQLVSHV